MDRDEAMRTARQWVAVRREVRAALIAAARELHPMNVPEPADEDLLRELHKLWHYPSDLSEVRLLALIDRPELSKPRRRARQGLSLSANCPDQ